MCPALCGATHCECLASQPRPSPPPQWLPNYWSFTRPWAGSNEMPCGGHIEWSRTPIGCRLRSTEHGGQVERGGQVEYRTLWVGPSPLAFSVYSSIVCSSSFPLLRGVPSAAALKVFVRCCSRSPWKCTLGKIIGHQRVKGG